MPESDCGWSQQWIINVRKMILAVLHLPPGITMDQYLLPPYSADEIVRTAIFQSEIVIGNLVMVRPHLPYFAALRLAHCWSQDLPHVPYL